jgi:hypothetical protein
MARLKQPGKAVRKRRTPVRLKTKRDSSRNRKSQAVPDELLAPMTGQAERQLRNLVVMFGAKKVRHALAPLLSKCRDKDWLCVANAISRIAQQQRRELGSGS